jgi:hypothetical protein
MRPQADAQGNADHRGGDAGGCASAVAGSVLAATLPTTKEGWLAELVRVPPQRTRPEAGAWYYEGNEALSPQARSRLTGF